MQLQVAETEEPGAQHPCALPRPAQQPPRCEWRRGPMATGLETVADEMEGLQPEETALATSPVGSTRARATTRPL